MTSTYWCERVVTDGEVRERVAITVAADRITRIESDVDPPAGAVRLNGLTLPGLANAHSHAFHRALRHRTHDEGGGSFWTWRERMYQLASRLDPDTYHRLARATFAEMALAGIVVVGEFHYLHHQPGGQPYRNANAMGEAVMAAADEAGIRITLLDTLYLHGGLEHGEYRDLSEVQRRFSDQTVDAWAQRVAALAESATRRVGAAVHSVRAVDPASIGAIAAWCHEHDRPLHAHVSEQAAENLQCLEAHGMTPTGVLAEQGAIGPMFTAVHGTHLDERDMTLLGADHSSVCLCPTTERDLADGIGPSKQLVEAGAGLCLGTDSQAVIDLFEEARALELNERLATGRRGNHTAGRLLEMMTSTGHRALGWTDAGAIRVGARADLVTVSLASVRTAGADARTAVAAAVFAATATDVTDVIIGGEVVVANGSHRSIDVAEELHRSIMGVWSS